MECCFWIPGRIIFVDGRPRTPNPKAKNLPPSPPTDVRTLKRPKEQLNLRCKATEVASSNCRGREFAGAVAFCQVYQKELHLGNSIQECAAAATGHVTECRRCLPSTDTSTRPLGTLSRKPEGLSVVGTPKLAETAFRKIPETVSNILT